MIGSQNWLVIFFSFCRHCGESPYKTNTNDRSRIEVLQGRESDFGVRPKKMSVIILFLMIFF